MNCSCLVHNARSKRKNPLRQDPTRTVMMRKQFMANMARRFKRVQKAVVDFLVVKDALGLSPRPKAVFNVQPREYEFLTDANKLAAFNAWFQQQLTADVLSVPEGTDPTQPWTAEYAESAYKRGLLNAYMSTKEAHLFDEPSVGEMKKEDFLRAAFSTPEAVSKIRFLATRSYESLKGVNAAMASEMNRILAEGMLNGSNVETIARNLAARIGSLTVSRAMTIARTEIIAAHAEGQLDAFGKLGIASLGIKAEWSTAGDDRVCPKCLPNEGQTFTIEEARGLIPLHPGCRCAWIPSEVQIK